MIVGGVRLDVDDRVRLHCRIQSGASPRPPGGLPERLDNYGPLLRSASFGCGVHTLSARHRTQRAGPDDDNRLANVDQSCRSSSFSSVAIPSSVAGRLEFLQPQVRPSPSHRSLSRLVRLVCRTLSPSSSFDVYRRASYSPPPTYFLMFTTHSQKTNITEAPPSSPSMHSPLLGVGSTVEKGSWSLRKAPTLRSCCSQQSCMPSFRSVALSPSHLRNDTATPSSLQTLYFLCLMKIHLFFFVLIFSFS